MCSDFAGRAKAIHIWHVDIQNDDIPAAVGPGRHGFVAIAYRLDIESCRLQQGLQHGAIEWIVIGDEHARRAFVHGRGFGKGLRQMNDHKTPPALG